MPLVEVNGITKTYEKQTVFHDLSFTLGRERIAMIGPTACGKTTLLRILLGLEPADAGSIRADRRRLSICLQNESLLPWLTVQDNLRAVSDLPDSELLRALERVGLADFRDHFPLEISGGMQQKLNLIRAFLPKPELLLMDEPFVHLDHSQKLELCALTQRQVEALGCGLLLVTHDIDEALLLSDEIWLVSRRPLKIRERISSPLGRIGEISAVHAHPEYLALFERILIHLREEHAK